jgi:hypothetical protein
VSRCDMGAFEYIHTPILYVEAGTSGYCTSWADACELQDALAAALSGDEIWAAEGIYYPGPSGILTATFTLKSGVALYGGFAGTEATLEERDWAAHLTILSGDIDQDDVTAGGVVTDTAKISGENAYHVVSSAGVTTTAVLDGFTITAGDADSNTEPNDRGGGMYNESSSPTLSNVAFSGNTASDRGGGMYNESSSPTLSSVAFSGNSASVLGGGMFNGSSSPTLTNVTFSGNSASFGGGLNNEWYSSPTLTNVTFSENTAANEGGGMRNHYQSNSTLTNVTFYNNSASSNSAYSGGGIYNSYSDSTVTNAILWGNTPNQIYGGSPTITYSDIQGGYSGTGNIDQDPLLGPLADNGGFTMTHALPYGSPAIDAGSPATCPASDQRGRPRPVDGDGDGVWRCDMGAYEYIPLYVYLPLVLR